MGKPWPWPLEGQSRSSVLRSLPLCELLLSLPWCAVHPLGNKKVRLSLEARHPWSTFSGHMQVLKSPLHFTCTCSLGHVLRFQDQGWQKLEEGVGREPKDPLAECLYTMWSAFNSLLWNTCLIWIQTFMCVFTCLFSFSLRGWKLHEIREPWSLTFPENMEAAACHCQAHTHRQRRARPRPDWFKEPLSDLERALLTKTYLERKPHNQRSDIKQKEADDSKASCDTWCQVKSSWQLSSFRSCSRQPHSTSGHKRRWELAH